MQITFKKHIMDEISDQVEEAAKDKKRIDIITLDQYEWTEFKAFMSTSGKSEKLAESYTINDIIIRPESIKKAVIK
jgi:hypothetical protein